MGSTDVRQQEMGDGSLNPYLEIPFYSKNRSQTSDSGTVVTLIGKDEQEDTFTSPPEGNNGVHWLSRYLNGRYTQYQKSVDIRVSYAINPDQPTVRKSHKKRKILGMKKYLDKYKIDLVQWM